MSKLSEISRRDFVKTTAYVAPLILTLKATPSLAGQGSYKKKDWGNDKHNKPGNGHKPNERGHGK